MKTTLHKRNRAKYASQDVFCNTFLFSANAGILALHNLLTCMTTTQKPSLLDREALQAFLTENGEKPYRLAQIEQAIYKDFIHDISEITTLPVGLREELAAAFVLSPMSVKKDNVSADGTNKFLFETSDEYLVESVLMRHKGDRLTLCISSQVGCPVKCSFCATGTMGYSRNLTTAEIVAQVFHVDQKLKATGERVRNIVFMGMGEPLINFDNVMETVAILKDQKKFEIGARHITISTSGIVPRIKDLMNIDRQVNLAVSLHAPNDAIRTKIMPINTAYPLEQLMAALKEYTDETNKRIFYEYIMLGGINDSPLQAHELAHLLKGQLAHVNLIPYNPNPDMDLKTSSRNSIKEFQAILNSYDVPCTIRFTLGQDIDAACGQLAVKEGKNAVAAEKQKKIAERVRT